MSLNIPTRTTIQITYADPTGVGLSTTGSENKTGISQFNFLRPNMLLDGNATTLPAAAGDGLFEIQRLNGLTTEIATIISLQPTNTVANKGGLFPKGVNAGQLQFTLTETVVLAAGIQVRWTFAQPII